MAKFIRNKIVGILAVMAFLLGMFDCPSANADWKNRDWRYRVSHVINAAAGAGTDYQVSFVVNSGTGTNSGNTVYCNNHCQSDFSDVRFTGSDGTTDLYYWREDYTASTTANFWVKVSADLSTVNQTVYMYYGNTGVATTSDGSNTFLFFDDFSGTLAKWTVEKTSGLFPQIQGGGFVRMGGGSTGSPYGHTSLGSSATYSGFNNNAFDGKFYLATDAIGEQAFRGNFAGNTGYKSRSDSRAGQGQSILKPPYTNGSWGFLASCGADGSVPTALIWYKFSITANGTTLKFYRDGVLRRNCTDSSYSSAGEVALQNHYGSYTDYDDVRVRKFVDPEPAHGTYGAEEYIRRIIIIDSY